MISYSLDEALELSKAHLLKHLDQAIYMFGAYFGTYAEGAEICVTITARPAVGYVYFRIMTWDHQSPHWKPQRCVNIEEVRLSLLFEHSTPYDRGWNPYPAKILADGGVRR